MLLASKLAFVALGCSGAVSALPALARRQNSSSSDSCQQTKVLVLGAGVAGIIAAQSLANASIDDFIIVEYQPQIGGRLFNQPFGQQPNGAGPYRVEYGANWVQGLGAKDGPQNPIWTLAQKWNLINTFSNYSDIATYDSDGANDYLDLMDDYETAYHITEMDAGEILNGNMLDNNMQTGLSLGGWNPGTDPHKQATDWWSWDFEDAYEPEKCSQLYGVAGYNATRYYYSADDNFVHDPRGFNAFIQGEASTFLRPNDTRVLLNTVVSQINQADDSVTVRTQDGKCIRAERAICTFSAGVLQNSLAGSAPVAFDPPLPRWKQTAIRGWNMGLYTKIFYQFPRKFWPDTQFHLYADNTTRGYYPLWQSLSLPGFLPDSNIIFVTVTDDMARRVEAQSDDETRAEGLEVLRRMFPDQDVPEPTAFAHPRWGSTPWAFGSYSNWPTGVTLKQHQNLRATVGNRLWFAGEHTSAEFYGFLQGAYFEGRNAGEMVAHCVASGDCDGEVAYTGLVGTTSPDEYANRNGWYFNTFSTYGLDQGDADDADVP